MGKAKKGEKVRERERKRERKKKKNPEFEMKIHDVGPQRRVQFGIQHYQSCLVPVDENECKSWISLLDERTILLKIPTSPT
jgi:hypothetical protein